MDKLSAALGRIIRHNANAPKASWRELEEAKRAIEEGDSTALADALVELPRHLLDAKVGASRLLLIAVVNGNAAAVNQLLAAGTNVDKASTGVTPLYAACAGGHTECARHLLAAGAKADYSWVPAYPPMRAACTYGHFECVKLLSSYGAKRQVTMHQPRLMEDEALNRGFEEIAEWLEATVDWTPLHHMEQLTPERTRALLRSGANPHARVAPGVPTPLERAEELLQEAECDGMTREVAELVVRAASWSPDSHELFPAAVREHAVELLKIGQKLADDERASLRLPTEVWQCHVMPHAVN